MAKLRVVHTPVARRDLNSIFDWIADDSGSRRARAVLERMEQAFGRLAIFPGMGPVHPEYAGSPRVFPISPWMIVYKQLDDCVLILRVVDGRRDLSAVLGREEG